MRQQLDAYIIIALGSCSHVVMLCKAGGDAAGGAHAAGGRFEGCSVMHATKTAS